jgi:hypothetical protein
LQRALEVDPERTIQTEDGRTVKVADLLEEARLEAAEANVMRSCAFGAI